ncbi:hypothetical protein B0H63DRAFT_401836 [Podospora didyma]|uniref:sn-1-specific diacylglycerol lipase n=1 Tax=Podospora didyma TaxID=330526 RepID=A0AAE0N604_9PEZI|nr:hypothetical protein B0H63DRAFT_401836 [Podospora didyma]
MEGLEGLECLEGEADASSSHFGGLIPDDDAGAQFLDLASASPGKTLLPGPLARTVSFATRSTSLVLRMGTIVTGYSFDTVKVTTLSSLELGRSILEGILGRAGRDVINRSGSGMGKAEAENILEKSLDNLHRTMTQIVFWTTTGFHMTGTTLSMLSETSQLLLSALDQFFGSTDSSRAMASIITLIRREFQNPATGRQGEKVGVMDLMLGLCGMAYLQRWCRRLLEEENRSLQIEETVWDVVVLSNGVRVDLHEESLYGVHGRSTEGRNGGILTTLEDHGAQDSDDDRDDLPEIRLRQQIMRSLPDDAKVSITTLTNTTKTITVDITGRAQDVPIPPPPGVELIEESRDSGQLTPRAHSQQDTHPEGMPETCRVVYRLNRSKERRTSFQKEDGDISQVTGFVESLGEESDQGSATEDDEDTPPSVPPKPSGISHPAPTRRPSSSASVASSSSTPSTKKSRIPSLPKYGAENAANQKRPRKPLKSSSTAVNSQPPSVPPRKRSTFNALLSARTKEEPDAVAKKGGGFRNAFRRSGISFSKDDSGSEKGAAGSKRKVGQKLDSHSTKSPKHAPKIPSKPVVVTPPAGYLDVPGRRPSFIPKRESSRAQTKAGPAYGSRSTGSLEVKEPYARSDSRTSYYTVHERRRDSTTETYEITTTDDYQPVSPDALDASPMANKMRSDKDVSNPYGSLGRGHRRVKSQRYTPSIYSLGPNESINSLVPYSSDPSKSAFNDTKALGMLRRAGMVDGMFPKYHLLRNITRYMRFASASYGSSFLKVLGIAKEMPILRDLDDTHHELRSFAHHTESDASSILLSSFVDPQGGSDGTGSTNTGVPLVHYISLDHESKAVVLACRGTLGFEDVLADMTCDYDDLVWRGNVYKVHKGIHASAQRLLYGGDGRVLYTLKQALEQFPDYGLVLTGHSLGGAVTALLGVMLSEPAPGTSFMTSADPHTRLLGDGRNHHPLSTSSPPRHICLPSGRPIHVYAYGPPSTMSASLCAKTRGLITSIVNGNDLVPYLSLGVLHDFQAVALAFKTDNNEAKVEVRQRIWEALQTGIADKWYGSHSLNKDDDYMDESSSRKRKREDDDQWAYAALKVLRASMMSHKLMPPGEVFVVESTRVLRRDAFLLEGEDDHYGRPANRVVLKYIRDVERRFREVRFGTSMLTDHSPGKYEDALNKLKAGVMQASP